jgi:hypothetical protein
MIANQDNSLTPEEFASLDELAKGPLTIEIPVKHAEKFLKLSLIVKVRSEYFLTEAGERRLVLRRP